MFLPVYDQNSLYAIEGVIHGFAGLRPEWFISVSRSYKDS